MAKKVSYIFPISHHYRYAFHEKLRNILQEQGVDYRVIYSKPFGDNLLKGDTVDIRWGRRVPLIKARGILLQFALVDILLSDLVIIQQENKLLINYLCYFLHILGLKKVAHFGHGRNMQAVERRSLQESWKKFWATKVHWWFAYTNGTGKYISSLGFPSQKITVFNNSIDVKELKGHLSNVTASDKFEALRELNLKGNNIGIFIGGLYREKRVLFLLEAAKLIRAAVPDFELIVVGGGPDGPALAAGVSDLDWVRYIGPAFSEKKALLMTLSKVYLMPGLVGLGILDAYSAGLPVVTTSVDYHSPEIEYLCDGVNGIVVKNVDDPHAYAEAVSSILLNPGLLKKLSAGACESSNIYSVESMAENFAIGVFKALDRTDSFNSKHAQRGAVAK